MLEQAAADGNRDAAFLLAGWYLGGQLIPRDLARARAGYERAAELGHDPARMIALSWLAGGTGGPADWPSAIGRLRGLAGENSQAAAELALIEKMDLDTDGFPATAPVSETISEAPLARCFRGFASDEECAYLIASAGPHLQAAVVGNPAMSGGLVRHQVRTCQSMGFPLLGESPFIHAINRRIAAASGTDVRCGEPTQIFKYGIGEEFKPHLDSSSDFPNQRSWTFLAYLNDDYEGGETRFLASGLEFKGQRGDALLFSNVDSAGNPDPASEHAGLPVSRGTKWLLSRWIREKPIDLETGAVRPRPSR
jgi:prolyl 4-hydroxylase